MYKLFFKEVFIAIDGLDALYKYELYLPDIVTTDLNLSEMNGFDLIKEIRKKSNTTYIIVISSLTSTNILIDAIHNEVDRYIIKPLTKEKFLNTVKAYLKKSEKKSNIIDLAFNIKIFLDKHYILLENQKIHINKKEVQLLTLLNKSAKKTVSYEHIEEQIWGSKTMSLSAIRTLVRDLRKKFGKNHLINVSGIGYRLK